MISLSHAAAREVQRIQASQQKPNSYLRIGVASGGCSGLIYTIGLDNSQQESDRIFVSNDINILVNEVSLSQLQNLQLDFSEDLMGGGFRFQNPQAVNTCSCGQSFAIEA